MTKSIGIDIGGTNFRIGVFEDLKLLNEIRIQANLSDLCKSSQPDIAWNAILGIIGNSIADVLVKHGNIKHIGIGFPGFIHPKTKVISESPNLPGLKNVNLASNLSTLLKKKFHIDNIIVENDALAAAYGEYCLAQQETPSLLYFGLGTGVGGGLILDGQPYMGENGMAMEIGHIIVKPNGRLCGCGNLGCVEQYASATGVEKTYFQATGKNYTASKISDLAQNGDTKALAAFQLAGEYLAVSVAHTLKILDIPTVLIGGGLSKSWGLMKKSFDQTLNENLIPVLRGKPHILISTAEDSAGMLGAAMLALKAIN